MGIVYKGFPPTVGRSHSLVMGSSSSGFFLSPPPATVRHTVSLYVYTQGVPRKLPVCVCKKATVLAKYLFVFPSRVIVLQLIDCVVSAVRNKRL